MGQYCVLRLCGKLWPLCEWHLIRDSSFRDGSKPLVIKLASVNLSSVVWNSLVHPQWDESCRNGVIEQVKKKMYSEPFTVPGDLKQVNDAGFEEHELIDRTVAIAHLWSFQRKRLCFFHFSAPLLPCGIVLCEISGPWGSMCLHCCANYSYSKECPRHKKPSQVYPPVLSQQTHACKLI